MKQSLNHKPYQNVRVFVLGASGFIGRWVAKLLSDQDADLILAGRSKRKLMDIMVTYSIKAEPFIWDIGETENFEDVFRVIRPDITFNLAGYGVRRDETDEKIAWRINANLVEDICMTLSKEYRSNWKGLQFVHVGSGFEYGSIPGVISESSLPRPDTTYGKSKLAGTEKIQNISKVTGLRAVTARLFTVYGPGENSNRLLPSIINAAKNKRIINMTKGEQKRDFTYVRDVAEGLIRLGLEPDVRGQVINLATGNLTSVRKFVECAGQVLGMDPALYNFGVLPYREDEVWQDRVDVSFLRECIQWVPSTSIAQGIAETIKLAALKMDQYLWKGIIDG